MKQSCQLETRRGHVGDWLGLLRLSLGLMALALIGTPGWSADDTPRQAPAAQEVEFFERQVRPILAENCYSCHGQHKQRAGLRLDSKAAALKGSETRPVLVPGDPDKSPLINAVRYHGDIKMPPTGKMPDQAVDTLTVWVKRGAVWPADRTHASSQPASAKTHWAFQPVRKPSIPSAPTDIAPQTAIDAFVFRQLFEKGLTPSEPADRRTLIRRATFDLVGLPPTPEEVETFVNDPSPDAFARLVDRLLASPAYGERWGRHWLDVARYADTKGYLFMQERRFQASYTYRDYVIRAFNEDLPYDQFIVQQLAADQLSLGEDRKPLAAMGYLTLGRRFLNSVPDIIDDRIDVVTRGLLGLTVSCARCHDHKYDPIPTVDYYSLYSVFANSEEPAELPLIAPPEDAAAAEAFETELKSRQQRVEEFLETARAETARRLRGRIADLLLAAHNAERRPGEEPEPLFLKERLPPGIVKRWQTFLETTRQSHHPVMAPWHAFAVLPRKDFAAQAPAVAARVAANADRDKPINILVSRAFADQPPTSLRDVAVRYGSLFERIDRLWREYTPSAEKQVLTRLPDGSQEAIRQVLYADPSLLDITPADAEAQFDDKTRNKLAELRRQVDEWRTTGPGAPPRAMVLHDRKDPQPGRVFVRGNPQNLGAVAPPQFLGVLAKDKRERFTQGSGRLELAQAIADPENPLTARVLVNRVWMHHFGAGLVRTPSDFGLRGEPPTHPELLDFLAAWFVENGWSIKALHRLIMLSNVYQQRSEDNPKVREIDPENRLLWRMNRRRLEFEALRDAMIAVAGRLDMTQRGRSIDIMVSPFSPRRTIYGFIDRQNLPGIFRTFDFASPDTSSPQRHQTTVPQQALFLMNSPFVIEQAAHLVARPDVAELGDHDERIQHLYKLIYGRTAESNEIALARRFLDLAAGDADQALDPWVRYVQVLLLTNEFTFVD
jgi:hypothetical protein